MKPCSRRLDKRILFCILLATLTLSPQAFAGKADVLKVQVNCHDRRCSFDVTVRHADAGWDHYANEWQVVAPDGTVLGTRTLYHPHVNEQPFTRSLSGVRIPPDIHSVTIRARDTVHGYGGREQLVELPPH